jgi:hypothetical protein
LGTDSDYEWTLKRELHYHRFKRFCGWHKGRNARKPLTDFEKCEKEHSDGVTFESIIGREEKEQEVARARLLEEEESWRIAALRKELIRLIRRKDWTEVSTSSAGIPCFVGRSKRMFVPRELCLQ